MSKSSEKQDPWLNKDTETRDPWLSEPSSRMEEQPKGDFKQMLMDMLTSTAGQVGEAGAPFGLSGYGKGVGESVPNVLSSAASGLMSLFGGKKLPQTQLPATTSLGQTIGRIAGPVGTYGVLAAPMAAGSEAALASLVPGYVGRSIGAGLTGAALEPGDSKQKLRTGAEFGGLSLAGEGIPPLLKLGKSIVSGYKPREAADVIQTGYDTLKDKLSKMFTEVHKKVESEGISKVPLRKNMITEIKEEGPKTRAFKQLADKSEDGSYASLRKLQTDLGKRAEKFSASSSAAENDVADLLKEQRKEVNDSIANHLESSGHKEQAHKLRTAMDEWANMLETYHSHPTIKKLVGPSRKVPKNLISTLSEDSVEMKRLLQEHPEIKNQVDIEAQKEKFKNILKMASGLGMGEFGLENLFHIGQSRHYNE